MRKTRHKLAIYGKMYGHTLPTVEKMENRLQFWLELIIDVMIKPLCFIEGHIQQLFFMQENY